MHLACFMIHDKDIMLLTIDASAVCHLIMEVEA